jgi:hypothetical protein
MFFISFTFLFPFIRSISAPSSQVKKEEEVFDLTQDDNHEVRKPNVTPRQLPPAYPSSSSSIKKIGPFSGQKMKY